MLHRSDFRKYRPDFNFQSRLLIFRVIYLMVAISIHQTNIGTPFQYYHSSVTSGNISIF